ncbi:MAG TPA: nucleotide exchange factor GrpE, partial [Candidatus Veblenbacteria bacterium]
MSHNSPSTENKPANELESVKNQAAEYLAGWQRAKADYANLKRETEGRMIELTRYANEEFIRELLPLVDYFKQALRAVPKEEAGSSWVEGIRHIQTRLLELLAYHGVKEMDVVGEKFNPELHEAVDQVEGGPSGTILEEVRTGFYLHDRVLQP